MQNRDSLALKTDILDEVLERMANGEVIPVISADLGYSPSAFYHLAERNADFGQRYARARIHQAMAVAEDVIRIADEEEDPHKARVRCDARKWVAAKLDPAKFGDKTLHEHKRVPDDPTEATREQLLAIALGRDPMTIEHESADTARTLDDATEKDE